MWETLSFTLILVLLIGLMKVGEIRGQCEKPLMENMVLTEDSGQTSYPDGFTVTFKCSIGYQGTGSRSITCRGNQWTKLDLQCQKKRCPSLVEINNGKYLTPDGILYGARVTAQCDEGFLLLGPKIRTCLDNGWDGRDPVCEAVKCQAPSPIQNGQFEPVADSYKYSEVVTYSCSGGYTLDGESEISCSVDGTFVPPPPKCLVVECAKPDIKNAFRSEGKSPPYEYGSFVTYKCNEGFTMNGSGHLVCGVKGWNSPFPECIDTRTDPKPGPKPGPNPEEGTPAPPGYSVAQKIGIGIGVVFSIVVLLGVGVYCKKRGTQSQFALSD